MKRLFLVPLIVFLAIGISCKLTETNGNGGGGSVDTNAPIISGVSALSITSTGATITWTTDEPADAQVEYGTSDVYGTSSDLSTTLTTSHTMALTGLTPDTTYHFRVKSGDAADNKATSDDNTFTTLEIDTTSPQITAITATATSETSATITWTTNEAATSQVEYGNSDSYGQMAQDDTLKTSHSLTITGLTVDTTYHFRVSSADAEENESTSTDGTFTTLAVDPGGLATATVGDDIHALVNAERTSRSLDALVRSDSLDALAGEYAASQFSIQNDIAYLTYNAWQLTYTVGSPRFDEDTAAEQVEFCMDDSDMMAALLDEGATESGVGIATIGDTIYFVQAFDVIRTNGGDGEPIVLVENPAAVDPTWEQLVTFLETDTTDEIPYVLDSFVCGDFAEILHNNAEAAGIKTAYVAVRLTEEPGHALNAFDIGGTTVFVDVISADKVAYIEVGQEYGAIVLDAAEEFTYAYFETYVARFEAYLADADDYADAVASYNAEVTSYNNDDPVPDEYADRSAWYEALQAQQAELGTWLTDLEAEKAALGIGDTYFHPTEALAVDDPTVVDYYVHW